VLCTPSVRPRSRPQDSLAILAKSEELEESDEAARSQAALELEAERRAADKECRRLAKQQDELRRAADATAAKLHSAETQSASGTPVEDNLRQDSTVVGADEDGVSIEPDAGRLSLGWTRKQHCAAAARLKKQHRLNKVGRLAIRGKGDLKESPDPPQSRRRFSFGDVLDTSALKKLRARKGDHVRVKWAPKRRRSRVRIRSKASNDGSHNDGRSMSPQLQSSGEAGEATSSHAHSRTTPTRAVLDATATVSNTSTVVL